MIKKIVKKLLQVVLIMAIIFFQDYAFDQIKLLWHHDKIDTVKQYLLKKYPYEEFSIKRIEKIKKYGKKAYRYSYLKFKNAEYLIDAEIKKRNCSFVLEFANGNVLYDNLLFNVMSESAMKKMKEIINDYSTEGNLSLDIFSFAKDKILTSIVNNSDEDIMIDERFDFKNYYNTPEFINEEKTLNLYLTQRDTFLTDDEAKMISNYINCLKTFGFNNTLVKIQGCEIIDKYTKVNKNYSIEFTLDSYSEINTQYILSKVKKK